MKGSAYGIFGVMALLGVWAQTPSALACGCPDGTCGCVTRAIQPKASELAKKIEAILRAKGDSDKVGSLTVDLAPKTTPQASTFKCHTTVAGVVCDRQ